MKRKLIDNLYSKIISNQKQITVVGDSMIDEYYQVTSNRISPEFPIPVLKSNFELPNKIVPGGAANVIRQLENVNVKAKLVSIIDSYGYDAFNKDINVDYCVNCWNAKIPIKKRFYHEDFPLVRWDCETENFNLNIDDHQEAIKNIIIPKSDIIIFSDYDKGMFRTDWHKKHIKNNITIVDPKNGPASKWKHCTVFKPNINEAKAISGKKDPKDQMKYFFDIIKCKAVIITESGNKIYGAVESVENYFELKPQHKEIDVRSVIGAGDCFTAFLALSYAHKFKLEDCASIAFNAGLSYVRNIHNESLTILELLENTEDFDKIIQTPDILSQRKSKLVFTNGCFDILHEGHIQTLRHAKSCGEKLVVGINSDASVKKLKGKDRPVNNLMQRMKVVSQLNFVDYVVGFNEETPYEIIKKIKPCVLVKGGDYKKNEVVGHDLVKEVVISSYLPNTSTTNIINKLKK